MGEKQKRPVSSEPARRKFREIGPPRGAARLAGVLLHGRGRSPLEKVDLAARFGGLDGIRWMVPAADTGSWYPKRFFDGAAANEPQLTQAVERCHAAVLEASEIGEDHLPRLLPEQLVIAGFSQGASLALEYALRHPGMVGMLIVLTGAIFGPPKPPVRLDGLRVLLTGSDADDWVAEPYTLETARVFRELGADVTLRMYPERPHIVSEDEIDQARQMLKVRLAEAGAKAAQP